MIFLIFNICKTFEVLKILAFIRFMVILILNLKIPSDNFEKCFLLSYENEFPIKIYSQNGSNEVHENNIDRSINSRKYLSQF